MIFWIIFPEKNSKEEELHINNLIYIDTFFEKSNDNLSKGEDDKFDSFLK